LKAEAVTLFKEDVLALGQMVARMVAEMGRMLRKDKSADLDLIENEEKAINLLYQQIEENCLELLLEKDLLVAKDIRTLVGSTIIAAKFERMADHANRVARTASWAREDEIEVPPELPVMADAIHKMLQDVLFSFLTDASDKAEEILHRDSEIDYLDAVLSKRLLSDLGEQDQEKAQMRAQFLFCTRFLERMGDLCTSVAKRTYFISTGKRLKPETSNIASLP
jgi:phosphate transport system protein